MKRKPAGARVLFAAQDDARRKLWATTRSSCSSSLWLRYVHLLRPISILVEEWEGVVPTWQGREVDLHFVHLLNPAERVSGGWAEAAVEPHVPEAA